jgi:hypothetical protein
VGPTVFANMQSVGRWDPGSWRAWMRVLARCPGAVLELVEASADARALATREAAAAGVHPRRLRWRGAVSWDALQQRLAGRVHVVLDAALYSSHTTAAEALAAGAPVVTVAGAGRQTRFAAAAVARASGEWAVQHTRRGGEELAVALTRPPALADAPPPWLALRARLERAAAGREDEQPPRAWQPVATSRDHVPSVERGLHAAWELRLQRDLGAWTDGVEPAADLGWHVVVGSDRARGA